MQQLISTISSWLAQNKAVALATVVKVYGSAPRPLGAKMAVSSQGEMVGSVSGGCVESAVAQEALAVLDSGVSRLCVYGIGDEWAQGVGLACGGNIEVFIEPLPVMPAAWKEGRLSARVMVLSGSAQGQSLTVQADGRQIGHVVPPALENAIYEAALQALKKQQSGRRNLLVAGQEQEIFIDISQPRPQLVIVGAVHIAMVLVDFAHALGFHTTVIDPRAVFATRARFPQADEIIQRWPDEALAELDIHANTFIAVLSHDDKLDIPALAVALRRPARYVGALGSRQTMSRRNLALQEMGISAKQRERIHNPPGLDIGARTPEEIALAIMAEVVALKNGEEWALA